jgi:hypothetical protein
VSAVREYHASLRILQARRKEFLRQTEGRKVWRVDLPGFKNGAERHSDNITALARKLLAEAPGKWPDGVALTDVLETYPKELLANTGSSVDW